MHEAFDRRVQKVLEHCNETHTIVGGAKLRVENAMF